MCDSDPSSLEFREQQSLNPNDLPVKQFIEMEFDNASMIVKRVHEDLMGIKSVILGTGLLTPQIQSNADKMMGGDIPKHWDKMWEGPEMPLTWLRSVIMRKIALKSWVETASKGNVLDHPVNLADLLHPGTFLNAVRQETARLTNSALDALRPITAFSKSKLGSPKIVVEIEGMLCQGALFGKRLQEANSDSPELVKAPPCYLSYVGPGTEPPYSKGEAFDCPVYITTLRENLLTDVSVPIDGSAEKWVRSGVALFLQDS